MLGTIIGAGLSVAGSIAGGIAARAEAKKQAELLKKEKAKNEAWYNRRYNEDSTQRADAQASITRLRETLNQRSKNAAGTAAVMGGSESSVAAEKEAQNNAMAQTISNIDAAGEARKDSVEERYMARDEELTGQQQQASAAKSAGIAQAIAGVAQVGGSIATSLDSVNDNKKKQEEA